MPRNHLLSLALGVLLLAGALIWIRRKTLVSSGTELGCAAGSGGSWGGWDWPAATGPCLR